MLGAHVPPSSGSGAARAGSMRPSSFFLFTMVGSVLMLLAIMALYFHFGRDTGLYTFNLLDLYKANIPVMKQYWLFAAFALSFAIKVPMFPFHTWLPDAHTEGAHGGQRHSGRRLAENGDLWIPEVCHSPLPAGRLRRGAL